ncbi:molecular chaperone HtpG [Nitrosomonas oligotropha]|uniref:Chaperone protein HtpG n=1 Tax=Nitrosomonas oligotropha TaxID=42354 RepID=A0A1H8QU70_9PROT|nr:molecular chaperone HtpG [Nitrosomonas oligotropha]SDW88802.1 molecular chaperone HtpG [Nitrosomonas oligotropha]SEO57478.1 molecular chaperone HtpG [Nitrosomonas oligotropha]
MQAETTKEQLSFQTEAKQLLKLMIHSLYSNKEIFLRELISNASDAADKLRFEGLTDAALYESDSDLKIRVSYDVDERTITISDNGIGMSRQEVIDHIGTIAKSGTREFFNSLTGDQAKDAHLIGQFGVGFYSAFIIADKVTLVTRRAGLTEEHGVRWESSGEGDYTLETIAKPGRGTDVILHLRKDEDEFLNGMRIRNIIRKYSDHITLPIVMKKEEWSQEEKKNTITDEDEKINQANALWARSKNDITTEQYNEFYKHVAHDFEPPLAYLHARVEGKQEYTQLLYIPARAPFDLFDRERRHGIKLYVQRVFIMDDVEKLLPNYLRFVRGVVDSNNLPLNVSREILQESKDIDLIRAGVIKKVLGLIEDLSKNEDEEGKEKYKTFYREFGQVLKEGVGEDFSNRERIAKLLRFITTQSDVDEPTISLEAYVQRMKEGQEKIYYVTADSLKAAKNSPHLEVFRKKGIEVLLLSDRVDEWLVSNLTEFEGKPLQSVAKGGLDLGNLEDETEKEEREKETNAFQELTEKMKQTLSEQVKDVRVTFRLTESPACLVADTYDMSGNLERLLKSAGQNVPHAKPILEINPHHPMVQRLKNEVENFEDWSHLLFDQALLAEGGQLEDPAAFVKRLNELLLLKS